jgi:hypothetical protein
MDRWPSWHVLQAAASVYFTLVVLWCFPCALSGSDGYVQKCVWGQSMASTTTLPCCILKLAHTERGLALASGPHRYQAVTASAGGSVGISSLAKVGWDCNRFVCCGLRAWTLVDVDTWAYQVCVHVPRLQGLPCSPHQDG